MRGRERAAAVRDYQQLRLVKKELGGRCERECSNKLLKQDCIEVGEGSNTDDSINDNQGRGGMKLKDGRVIRNGYPEGLICRVDEAGRVLLSELTHEKPLRLTLSETV